jgi:hypothetical protein
VNTASTGFQYMGSSSQKAKLVSKICGGTFHVYARLYPRGARKAYCVEAKFMGVGSVSAEAMKKRLVAKQQPRNVVIDATTKITRWFDAYDEEVAGLE